MKKLLIIITLLSFINYKCDKSLNTKEEFFDPKDLSKLSLEHLDNFWINDSLKSGSNPFVNYSGYIGGIELTDNEKRIGIAIFESQATAINSMEGRINTVSNVIKSGDSNVILKGKWWYGSGFPNSVFANQWNTIVEVSHYNSNYEDVKTLLIETTAEICGRIDSLSQ